MILGTPKILRKAQKITNFEFEAHKKGDLIQLNCFLFFWKTSLIRVSSQMFNESLKVYESFCPDVKRLQIVLEMFQCAMPLMLFNICHICLSNIKAFDVQKIKCSIIKGRRATHQIMQKLKTQRKIQRKPQRKFYQIFIFMPCFSRESLSGNLIS